MTYSEKLTQLKFARNAKQGLLNKLEYEIDVARTHMSKHKIGSKKYLSYLKKIEEMHHGLERHKPLLEQINAEIAAMETEEMGEAA